jgi:hypothetical protein
MKGGDIAMSIRTELISRFTQRKINRATEKYFGKRLFYEGILPDPDRIMLNGEFGATGTTFISDEIAEAKMAAWRQRVKDLPNIEPDDMPTIPE